MLTIGHIFFFGTLSFLVLLALLQWEDRVAVRRHDREQMRAHLDDVISPDREAL